MRYIWIDSLCIIQDDLDDWQREAKTMGRVYSLSVCTISASHAADGEAGCFTERNPYSVIPWLMPSPFKANPKAVYVVHRESLKHRWYKNINRGPLYQRAWAMQERLLSPRTLYCGTEQMLWGWGSWEACESFPLGVNPDQNAWGFYGDRQRFARVAGRTAEESPEVSWLEIVQLYSATAITFPTDPVLAFSGIARELEQPRGKSCFYGHWLDDSLPWSLIWHRESRSRTSEAFAPSWSWLSMNAPVWVLDRRRVLGSTGKIHLQYPSPGEGLHSSSNSVALEPGSWTLHVSGVLKATWCGYTTKLNDGQRTPVIFQRTDLEKGEDINLAADSATSDIVRRMASPFKLYFRTFEESDASDVPLERVVIFGTRFDSADHRLTGTVAICLPLVDYSMGTPNSMEQYGIILENVRRDVSGEPTEDVPVFRRIGYYYTSQGNFLGSTEEMSIKLI
jgi:hypothetical protein